MMSTALTLSIAAVLVVAAPAGSLKVTQRHLVPVCLDAAPVRPARGRGPPAKGR